MQKRNSSDFILSTPQWSAICASEKGVIKHKLPDAIVDKRKVVVDPILLFYGSLFIGHSCMIKFSAKSLFC